MSSDPLKSAKNAIEATDKAARSVATGTAREAEWLVNQGYYAARRVRNRIRFVLERMILRGAIFRLMIISAGIAAISLVAGLLAAILTGGFESPGHAVWWAFLRMTDPGYLGDDEGMTLRIISTIVTVSGYVLFMGALIAIMTQWLNDRIKKLEMGLTPLVQKNHILVLGWTSRTADVLRALMMSEGRMKRFLLDLDSRTLNVVLLVDQVTAELRVELQEDLGPWWNERRITLRSGNMLSVDHLRRADFDNAAAIILPGEDYAGEETIANDTRILKAILSVERNLIVKPGQRPPSIVAEVFDARKVPIARMAYRDRIDILASDALVARIMAQAVRRPGYTHIVTEMLAHNHGQEVFVRTAPELAGKRVGGIHAGLKRGVFLGVVRGTDDDLRSYLNPPQDFELEAGDSIIVLAQRFEDCMPEEWQTDGAAAPARESFPASAQAARRVLLLGWSHKAVSLLGELGSFEGESYDVTVCSIVSPKKREKEIAAFGVETARLSITHVDGDFAVPAVLAGLKPESFDSVVLVASDRFRRVEERDARTVLGCLLLDHTLKGEAKRPPIVMELIDRENRMLFPARTAEVVLSPMLISYLLVQVALRRELGVVFDELFGPRGAEIMFVPASDFVEAGTPVSFPDIQRVVAAAGPIALGIRIASQCSEPGGGVELNPDRDRPILFGEADEVVVLAPDSRA